MISVTKTVAKRIGSWRGFALIGAGFALARLIFETDMLGRIVSAVMLASLVPTLVFADTSRKDERDIPVLSVESSSTIGVVGAMSVEQLLRQGYRLLAVVVAVLWTLIYFACVINGLRRRHRSSLSVLQQPGLRSERKP
jgi:hypothetical protein